MKEKMTMDEFYEILSKPNEECDGCDLHLRACYTNNNAKSIFRITGLDVSHLFTR